MKAIQMTSFGGPEVLRLTELPAPEPRAGEVRVRLRAAGVNPAETYVRTGTYAFLKPQLPYTPGFDGAGVIDSVGPGVTRLQKGARVLVAAILAKRNTGTYAEMVVCDESAVQPLVDHLSFAQGAAVGVPGHAAYRVLFQRARLKPGETVLIHGASGGVGTLAVQLARAHGALVIGTSDENGLDELRANGVHAAFSHFDLDHYQKIMDLTNGLGPNVIIESLADVNLEHDAEIIAKYGRIVVLGSRGALNFTPRLLMAKEASVLGMALWNSPPDEYNEAIAALSAGLEAGVLKPVTGPEYPLAEAGQAQADIIAKGQSRGKMILTID